MGKKDPLMHVRIFFHRFSFNKLTACYCELELDLLEQESALSEVRAAGASCY